MTDAHASPPGQPFDEDGGSAGGQDQLARRLSALARSLQADADSGAVLHDVVAAAIALVPGTAEASISIVTDRRRITSEQPSGELPRVVDALQTELGEGPCLDAVFREQTVRVPDMTHEERWPRFARRAAGAGAYSMLAFQLYVEGDNLGALNLYGDRADAFDDESEHIGLLLASHAAIAYADARKIGQLQRGIDRRDLIGQAKGIVMERFALTADQAFALLVRVSQHTNRKLYDVAEDLTLSGHLEQVPARPVRQPVPRPPVETSTSPAPTASVP